MNAFKIMLMILAVSSWQTPAYAKGHGHGGHGHHSGHSHGHSEQKRAHSSAGHEHARSGERRRHEDRVGGGGYASGWATGPGGYGYRTWNGTNWVWDYTRRPAK